MKSCYRQTIICQIEGVYQIQIRMSEGRSIICSHCNAITLQQYARRGHSWGKHYPYLRTSNERRSYLIVGPSPRLANAMLSSAAYHLKDGCQPQGPHHEQSRAGLPGLPGSGVALKTSGSHLE